MPSEKNIIITDSTDNLSPSFIKQNAVKKEVEVCMVTWEINDHIDELSEILQGVSVASVDQQLVDYVTANIEPTGWQAIWRANKTIPSEKIKEEADFIVDVINVSQVTLTATVFLKDTLNIHKDMENVLHLEISVPLIELYPTAYQENDTINIEVTTAVAEQLRFFYNHIWQPWDAFEEICCYTKSLIASRMKIYHQIKNEVIPRTIASQMQDLRLRAKKAADKFHQLEEKASSDDDVDQRDVVQLMKLNKEVEQLKARCDALGDPFLRELSLLQEQMERKDLVESCSSDDASANILVVASTVVLHDFVQSIADLPQLLDKLPKGPDVSTVKTFSSLQMALDSAKVGDTIALLPGTHILKHLGPLAAGGTICGIGPGVSIIGSPMTGDVFLDMSLSNEDGHFLLYSVDLRPLEFQTGILLHSGKITVKECTISGCSVGICLLAGSRCLVEESRFTEVDLVALECKGGSELIIKQSLFKEIPNPLQSEEGAKIIVNGKLLDVQVANKTLTNNSGVARPSKP